MNQNLRPNGHKFPYGATVHLREFPNEVGIVENYSSGENMPTLVYVEFKQDHSLRAVTLPNWYPEEDLILEDSDNPSRRDSY